MAAKVKAITYADQYAEYWLAQPHDDDTIVTSAASSTLGAARVSTGWTRLVPTGLREDRAVFSLWVAKIVTGGLYSKPLASELAGLETALDTALGSVNLLQSSDWKCVEYAWHFVDENSPRDQSGKGQIMGPAVRVSTKNLVGAGGSTVLPHQVSSTVTLRTASRRHWGRFYVPGQSSINLQTQYGRWTTSYVDSLANAFNTLHDTWQTAGFQLGVYSMFKPAYLTPKTVEVDDIPDIIRRRRAKQANYRKMIS